MRKILSGESRNIMNKSEDDDAESIGSSDDSHSQLYHSWENGSETTSNSEVSEIAIHFLLVEWKQRGLDREMHQDPDRDRYTSDEDGTVIDKAVDELALITLSKRRTRLLPNQPGTISAKGNVGLGYFRTNLEPSVQKSTRKTKLGGSTDCLYHFLTIRTCF